MRSPKPLPERDWLQPAPAVALENIDLSLDGHGILKELSLEVMPGTLLCLLGPSGSGKSTALRMIAGLERPDSGSLKLNGQTVSTAQKVVSAEERNLGFMFQDFALFPHLSVHQNVEFGLKGKIKSPNAPPDSPRGKKLSKAERFDRVTEVLQHVGLIDKRDLMPHALSGGQQQRVALARAMAPKPQILLLDEPFSGLEQSLRAQLRDDFLHLIKASGTTALMVTHDPEEAMFMADKIAVMRDGQIEQIGAPDDLYFQPASAFVAGFFGEINRLEGEVRRGWIGCELGQIRPTSLPEGTKLQIYIRPNGLKLCPLSGLYADLPMVEVEASRMIGTSSLVHMSLLGCTCGDQASLPQMKAQNQVATKSPLEHLQHETHLHARIQGGFLPRPGERFGVGVNPELTYAFEVETDQPLRL